MIKVISSKARDGPLPKFNIILTRKLLAQDICLMFMILTILLVQAYMFMILTILLALDICLILTCL